MRLYTAGCKPGNSDWLLAGRRVGLATGRLPPHQTLCRHRLARSAALRHPNPRLDAHLFATAARASLGVLGELLWHLEPALAKTSGPRVKVPRGWAQAAAAGQKSPSRCGNRRLANRPTPKPANGRFGRSLL